VPWRAGRRIGLRLPAVGVAHQDDHTVARRNILLQFFQQRAAVLLKILLHDHGRADRP
jgi:hypothetical protein